MAAAGFTDTPEKVLRATGLFAARVRHKPRLLVIQPEQAISEWVDDYGHERYHDSLDHLTSADTYAGRRNETLDQRAAVKRRTPAQRKGQDPQLAV